MNSPSAVMTDADREFLRRPLHGFFSTAAGPTPAQPRPVWFELTADDTVALFTDPATVKIRRLAADPRASLVVAAPVGERERWVSVSGPATVSADGADELVVRLAERYWDRNDPVRARDLADMLTQEWVRIVIHPVKVSRDLM
ncbi:pyridoxamine 5'-phosphate oxidase family protein [Mycolicibacterium sp. 050158]|uniref:pyridoxamine 5'-phosphate oxidase family protein n=1 Tax=Mycolicibacterium sp. 050158 TaxID=3090602 RepID=UPI00299EEB94|nr:pyridoxamine 5'-phosphate oxidase family protein [Mycolicibacterium sp. 050158]MDX1891672.1 pyridoxamine 5'-phosphate oxidase family protein [Mycolicibacterium sp. 050158]